jgi:hypothetical protein
VPRFAYVAAHTLGENRLARGFLEWGITVSCVCVYVGVQRKALEYMTQAAKLLTDDAKFSLEDGYSWGSLSEGTQEDDDTLALVEKREKRRRVDRVVLDLLKQVEERCLTFFWRVPQFWL